MTHICDWMNSPWPTGHPPPPENPAKLQGPEVGEIVRYGNEKYERWDGMLMRVKARSYVWSPGECQSKGGYRHYDWKVVEWPVLNRKGKVVWTSMVVNDDKLTAVVL